MDLKTIPDEALFESYKILKQHAEELTMSQFLKALEGIEQKEERLSPVQYYTIAEVQAILHCTKRTVIEMLGRRDLERIKLSRRKTLIPAESLEKLLNSGTLA